MESFLKALLAALPALLQEVPSLIAELENIIAGAKEHLADKIRQDTQALNDELGHLTPKK